MELESSYGALSGSVPVIEDVMTFIKTVCNSLSGQDIIS